MKIINKIIQVLYYSLFFITPLLMAPLTSELFEFNKLIFIYLITLGVSFLWLIKIILDRKIIIKKTPFDIPILLFLFSQIISTLISIDRHTSFFGYYGRFNGGLISLFSFLILFYGFVTNFSNSIRDLVKLLKVSLVSSFAVIVWGLTGKLGVDLSCLLFVGQLNNNCWTDQFRPAERMFSTLGQPNWLGAYLAINFFIGIYFFLKKIKETNKFDFKLIIITLYLFINLSSILFTRSRSALFAVIIGLGVTAIFLISKKIKPQPIFYKKIVILFVLLLFSVLFFKTGIEKIDRFISFSSYYKSVNQITSGESGKSQKSKAVQNNTKTWSQDITTSADIRKIVWQGAVDLGFKYPIFGTGVETFAYSYYFTRPKAHNLTSEWDYLYNKAHNEYLNYFATTGIVGIGTYLIFIFSVLIYGWKKINKQISIRQPVFANIYKKAKNIENNNETMDYWNNQILILCLLVSFLTILITNFFGFSTTTINLFFYLIPAYFVFLSEKQSSEKVPQLKLTPVSNFQKIKILLLLIVTFYFLIGLIRYYLADIKYSQGDNFSKLGDLQKAAKLLTEANRLKYDHVYEDRLSYVLANIAYTASYQKDKDLTKSMIKISDELNKKSINASPENVLYWKTRAKNYYLYYQINSEEKELKEAVSSLQKAAIFAPTDPKIPYSLAIFNSLLEDSEKDPDKKAVFRTNALAEVDKSIELKPDYRDGYFLKGQFFKKSGDKDAAKKIFNFILNKIDANDTEVKKELESL